METTVKCIYCGTSFTANLNDIDSHCPNCNKTFNTSRGAKYHKSVEKITAEEKKVAYGEMYQQAETFITEGEFYLKNEEYEKAKESFLSALKITTVDRRVYLGLIKTCTENFTNYTDVSHYEYLNKLISISNKEQKAEIRAVYAPYYNKRNMTKEELDICSEEELSLRKTRVEQLLKDGIPRHYLQIKAVKTYKILTIISIILSVILGVLALTIKGDIVETIFTFSTTASLILVAVFIVAFMGAKSKTALYDCVLDLFDELDNFTLTLVEQIDIFASLETIAVDYLNGVTVVSLENELTSVIPVLKNGDLDNANAFISKYKLLKKLEKELEDSEEQ